MKFTLIVSTVIFLTACTTSKSNQEYEELSKSKDLVCEYTASTGSHLKKRKCMSKELATEIRRRNQEAMRSQEHKGQTSAGASQ